MAPCSISPNIRGGLLETFYGVYEKDADKVIISLYYLFCKSAFIYVPTETFTVMQVLQAMIQMGVLVPTGDVTAVRRTAQFFLNRCSHWRLKKFSCSFQMLHLFLVIAS